MNLLAFDWLQNDPIGRGVALAMAVLGLAYILLRPKLKKKDPLAKPMPVATLTQQRAVERDMNHVLVELSAMARQISAQLDTRAAKLEVLIQEADQKIAQLRDLSGGSAPHAAPAAPADTETSPHVDPRHAEIYQLADEGLVPSQIAQRLDRPDGEIELILALRPDRH
jgi:hypothetical protein